MEADVDEIKLSWGVSHLDTGELEVTPTFTQVRCREPVGCDCDYEMFYSPDAVVCVFSLWG